MSVLHKTSILLKLLSWLLDCSVLNSTYNDTIITIAIINFLILTLCSCFEEMLRKLIADESLYSNQHCVCGGRSKTWNRTEHNPWLTLALKHILNRVLKFLIPSFWVVYFLLSPLNNVNQRRHSGCNKEEKVLIEQKDVHLRRARIQAAT